MFPSDEIYDSFEQGKKMVYPCQQEFGKFADISKIVSTLSHLVLIYKPLFTSWGLYTNYVHYLEGGGVKDFVRSI